MPRTLMVSSGGAGAPGPPGAPGPGALVLGLSGEALPDRSLVYQASDGLFYLATNSNPALAGTVVGFVQGAVAGAGLATTVIVGGELNGFAGLVAGTVYYIGLAGLVTSVPPALGLLQTVGVASAPNVLVIELGQPFVIV